MWRPNARSDGRAKFLLVDIPNGYVQHPGLQIRSYSQRRAFRHFRQYSERVQRQITQDSTQRRCAEYGR